MKFKDFKLGVKLGVGFGSLILIAMILGIMAIINMTSIRKQTNYLANEYLPELQIANNVELSFMEAIFELRGFSYSEDESFYKKGKQLLKETDDHLQDAYELAGRAEILKKLEGATKNIDDALQNYEKLIDETAEVTEKIHENRSKMDETAATYMSNCMKYLDNQNEAMSREIRAGTATYDRLDKITLINNIIDAGNAVRVANFKSQATRDPVAFQKAINEFEKSLRYFTEIRKLTKLEVDLKALDEIEKAANGYIGAMNDFLKNWEKREQLAKDRAPAYNAVIENSQSASKAAVEGTNTIADYAMQLLNTSNNVMIIGLIFALILGIILALVLTSLINNPIKKGVRFAEELAAGNLEARIDVDQKDEIGILAKALQGMAEKLKNIVLNIMSGADNIAAAAVELSSSSQQVSQGASEQASSAEEVSSSMEEMAANIQQNTDNANQTEKIALIAADGIKTGSESTDIAVDAMKNIADKIKIVNDIAFQTNILALNAAVEAARAGEHGKGFAVVAAEVRKLAERSKIAADEIDLLSKNGVEVSERAGTKLQEIVPEIEKTAKLVQEIAAASNEQNSGADQVNNAIQQLNQVTQQNAAASEEMATSSEELSSQAEELKRLISFFKVKNDGSSQFNKMKKYSSSSKKISHSNHNGGMKKTDDKKVVLEMSDHDKLDEEFSKF